MKYSNPYELVTDVATSKLLDEITLKWRPKEDIFLVFDMDLFEARLRAWKVLDKNDFEHFRDFVWFKDLAYFKTCVKEGDYRKLINDWMSHNPYDALEEEYSHLQKHLEPIFFYFQYREGSSIPISQYVKHNKLNISFKKLLNLLSELGCFQLSLQEGLIWDGATFVSFCDEIGIEVTPTETYDSWNLEEADLDDWSTQEGTSDKEKSEALINFMRLFKDWPKPRLTYTRLLPK